MKNLKYQLTFLNILVRFYNFIILYRITQYDNSLKDSNLMMIISKLYEEFH